ncbi:MAG TPA: hypothetical protein VIX80_09275 [Candidatus Kapabacteria bacterium]
MSHLLLEILDGATAVLWPDQKTPSVWVIAFVLVLLAGILVIVAAN